MAMRSLLITMAALFGLLFFGVPALLFSGGEGRDNKLEARLYPAFMAPTGEMPTFSDVQDRIRQQRSLRANDKCIDAAFVAASKDRSTSDKRAKYRAYLLCYVNRLERSPRTLCDPEKRRELARYTRGYFYLLDQDKKVSSDPVNRGFIEIQQKMRSGSDISRGRDDFKPDPAILESWARLVDIGALSNGESLEDLLQPEVPEATIQQLASLKVVHPLCP
jgi:hypothetical protein